MRIMSLLRLMRPPNGLLMFFAVLIGVLFSETRAINLQQIIYAFVTSFGLTGSSMALNDYFDKQVDLVNNPSRPIPSGEVSPASAVALSSILAGAGLLAAFLSSTACFLMAAVAFAVSTFYNMFLKKTGLVGNFAVSFTVVAPFLYGSLLADGYISWRVMVFVVLAFLANTGREVIKGITDVEGDAVRGVATIARKSGLRTASRVGAGFYIAAVMLSPLPYLLEVVNILYLLLVAVADAGFVYSSIRIIRNPEPGEAKKQKNLTLLWMLLALISFAAGGLV
ncbi:MAG: geranylgeranylglycerol-phosphate geranylgeranyltransferase [Candidatus Caldarchaeum sp.]